MSGELDIAIDGHLGRITLDRPAAINALSAGMIAGITEALTRWAGDDGIGAVLFEGAGEKGFCAGGDVRAARALVLAGRLGEADAYFAAEYRMNALIAGYAKPLVAITHGVVMGGGLGIAGHCGFRVTQPGARFAMPETAIGFFADVGVNAILAKAPAPRALLFALSGASVGAADALALGLADAVVAPERIAQLRIDIAAAAASPAPADAIGLLLAAESIVGGDTPFTEMAGLLPAALPESTAAFLDAVAAVPALAELSALLETRSPGALAANFHAQVAARRLMDVGRTLEMDARLAALMIRRPDFAEGVRAVLVDKDHRPVWQPATLAGLDPAPILAAVAGA